MEDDEFIFSFVIGDYEELNTIKSIFNRSEKIEKNGEEIIQINNFPSVPTTDKNIDYLYILISLNSIILREEGVKFPTYMNRWIIDIQPTEENINNNSFSLIGIKKIIENYRNRLQLGKSFIKFQVIYLNDDELPTVRILFFQLGNDGENRVSHESFLYPFLFPVYEENFFSDERIKKMNDNKIDFRFIEHLPIVNLSRIEFDKKGHLSPLKELEKYSDNWD